MLLEGKIALVTGASRGIGKRIATTLAGQGACVYANARTEGALDDLIAETGKTGDSEILPLYFDVSDSQEAKAAILAIKKEQGKLDILVNNAGIMKDALIGMIPDQLMQDTFATNVFATINLTQLASKLMSRQKSGSIINIASMVGEQGNDGQTVYASSKGAVSAFTKAASKELAAQGIRVNAVAPGVIDTDLVKDKEEAAIKFKIGLQRLGTPEDIANACLFFASDLSSYVTGQVLTVSGGAII